MIEVKKILVPIDFSEYSKNALRFSIEFAQNFGSSLHLLNVIEPILYPSDFSTGEIVIPAPQTDIEHKFEDEIKNLRKSIVPETINCKTVLRTGKPFLEIINYAADEDIDLIIIATHGHTGVEHLLFGSTAEKVVRKAPCPVLTLRDPIKGFKYSEGC